VSDALVVAVLDGLNSTMSWTVKLWKPKSPGPVVILDSLRYSVSPLSLLTSSLYYFWGLGGVGLVDSFLRSEMG
jgi:hypothetical protein